MEIKSPKEDINTTDYPNWFDRNNFKKMLAIIGSNKFNYKNKTGEFNYIDIKDLVNNIRNKTISEIHAKKDLNTLNKIKNTEIIKHKKHTSKQMELLNLFNDLLDTILTDKTLKSKSQKDNTLMSSNDEKEKEKENEKEKEKEKEKENGNENDNENKNDNNIIKQLNYSLDEITDKSKSFEEQIELIRKVENLDEYGFMEDYGDKELKFKIFNTVKYH